MSDEKLKRPTLVSKELFEMAASTVLTKTLETLKNLLDVYSNNTGEGRLQADATFKDGQKGSIVVTFGDGKPAKKKVVKKKATKKKVAKKKKV
jgi:hypothetical protein